MHISRQAHPAVSMCTEHSKGAAELEQSSSTPCFMHHESQATKTHPNLFAEELVVLLQDKRNLSLLIYVFEGKHCPHAQRFQPDRTPLVVQRFTGLLLKRELGIPGSSSKLNSSLSLNQMLKQ